MGWRASGQCGFVGLCMKSKKEKKGVGHGIWTHTFSCRLSFFRPERWLAPVCYFPFCPTSMSISHLLYLVFAPLCLTEERVSMGLFREDEFWRHASIRTSRGGCIFFLITESSSGLYVFVLVSE
jgi:hypothetical protein